MISPYIPIVTLCHGIIWGYRPSPKPVGFTPSLNLAAPWYFTSVIAAWGVTVFLIFCCLDDWLLLAEESSDQVHILNETALELGFFDKMWQVGAISIRYPSVPKGSHLKPQPHNGLEIEARLGRPGTRPIQTWASGQTNPSQISDEALEPPVGSPMGLHTCRFPSPKGYRVP